VPAITASVAPNDHAIHGEGLTRRFDDFVAVRGLDIDVPTGTILGLVGPSGSGKTTTIRMITGSLAPTEGKVTVLGDDPATFNPRTRERIGYMPQGFILYPDLTTEENVDFVASIFGLLWIRRRRRRRAVLELLDMWKVRRRRASQLSGGMKRRLELACALVHEPDLLILDEPTAGIDPLLRRTVWDEVHRLRDRGVTALVTTQYVTEAEECDAVALLDAGRMIALGSPDQLRRDALGGDILDVALGATFDASSLAQEPFVRRTRQTGLREFQVTVDDAATATPELVAAIERAGGEVESVSEFHPTFDDVFAELVQRHRAENGTPDAADESASPPKSQAA